MSVQTPRIDDYGVDLNKYKVVNIDNLTKDQTYFFKMKHEPSLTEDKLKVIEKFHYQITSLTFEGITIRGYPEIKKYNFYLPKTESSKGGKKNTVKQILKNNKKNKNSRKNTKKSRKNTKTRKNKK